MRHPSGQTDRQSDRQTDRQTWLIAILRTSTRGEVTMFEGKGHMKVDHVITMLVVPSKYSIVFASSVILKL